MLTTRHLAKKHGVTQRTIQRWLKDGWRPYIADEMWQTDGGHWRFGRAPVLADIEEGRRQLIEDFFDQASHNIKHLIDSSRAGRLG